jgi:hypothetical protein
MRRTKKFLAMTVAVGLIAGALAGTAGAGQQRRKAAPLKGEGEGLKLIKNFPWVDGSDQEFTTIKGRKVLFAASFAAVKDGGGLHVIDVTNPAKPKQISHLKCSLYQGDVQVSWNKRYVYLAADDAGGPESCLAVGKLGFMIIDVKNLKKPKPVGFAEIPRGSHNITAHPTKPFVYNSDSDLAHEGLGVIEVWNVKNARKPKKVFEHMVGVHSPHDVSFNRKGTRAITAAISHIDLLDTTNPAKPVSLFTTQCPGCTITHDAKFTPDGNKVLIGDEAGGGATMACPGGALYAYTIEGTETQPVLVPQGTYWPDELVLAQGPPTDDPLGYGCTSHVMDVSDNGKQLAISWYTAGTRLLDISNTMGATIGENGTGIKELGWFIPQGGNSWSSKFSHNHKYIYSNDMKRGLDVYKIVKK